MYDLRHYVVQMFGPFYQLAHIASNCDAKIYLTFNKIRELVWALFYTGKIFAVPKLIVIRESIMFVYFAYELCFAQKSQKHFHKRAQLH